MTVPLTAESFARPSDAWISFVFDAEPKSRIV